jgi:hypothetical protein
MFKKIEFREKLFNFCFIVALIAGMVIWIRYQGMNVIMEMKYLITKNTMSDTGFIMSFYR